MTNLPWHDAAWAALARLNDRWPHALLIHGQAGIGKRTFARRLAKALLCEARGEPEGEAGSEAPATVSTAVALAARPCDRCVACGWFEQGNHPDFRLIAPEALTGINGDAAADAGDGKSSAKSTGKSSAEEPAKTKALSKEIKIEQIRSLLDFAAISAHRGGYRIVLLYPAETMNGAAANALLKTLEEPPEGVRFIVVTSRIERLLPTIVSRCRRWPLAAPDASGAIAWLQSQGMPGPAAAAALAAAGGAPLTALAAVARPEERSHQTFALTQLENGAACDAFACGESLQKGDVPLLIGCLQRWAYDLLSVRQTGKARYYPDRLAALQRCAAAADPAALALFVRELSIHRAAENHPLNPRLVIEQLFYGYRDLFLVTVN